MDWGWHKGGERLTNRTGLTLLEVITSLAIAGVLVAAAVPAFLESIQAYRFNAAVRQVAGDIQMARSLAITTGGCYGLHSGSDPLVNRPNQYRLERGNCNGTGWPTPTDTPATNSNVITGWVDVNQDFPGVTLDSMRDNASVTVNGVIFNSRGASVNPFVAGLIHPITITVTNTPGATRSIQVRSTGSVRVL